jgi:hypothetical protein
MTHVTSVVSLCCGSDTDGYLRERNITDVYNWFIEGFDTADVKDDKALLEELNQQLGLFADRTSSVTLRAN